MGRMTFGTTSMDWDDLVGDTGDIDGAADDYNAVTIDSDGYYSAIDTPFNRKCPWCGTKGSQSEKNPNYCGKCGGPYDD